MKRWELMHERIDYSAMPLRQPIKLPEKARIAIYSVVNIEEWDVDKPLPREYVPSPSGVPTVPNIPNWAWHEYGMRVGIWRILEAMEKRGIKANATVNACVTEGQAEAVTRAMLDAGWDFIGHGYSQSPLHIVDDQKENINRTFQSLKSYTGRAPKGWLGPGLQETHETLDYLSEAGFKYVCDWAMDEHPVDIRTRTGSMVAMPYSFEVSDLPMMLVHHHDSEVWLKRTIDQFDRLYEEGVQQPRIMSMGVHPYIMGVPHRIKYLEAAYDYILKKKRVWFASADEIYDWYISQKG